MGRSKSSNRWLSEHHSDEFVKLAQRRNYRSRSVFKLKEIDERDRLFKVGGKVLDLGAAPGGWSQYAYERVGTQGSVIALDMLEIDPIPGVRCLRGDFREHSVLQELVKVLDERKVDVILSDMAPNQSGQIEIDQPKSMYLAELALEMAHRALAVDGVFLVKIFQGAGFDRYYQDIQRYFSKILIRKPKASRARSREVFFLAKGFKPAQIPPISIDEIPLDTFDR